MFSRFSKARAVSIVLFCIWALYILHSYCVNKTSASTLLSISTLTPTASSIVQSSALRNAVPPPLPFAYVFYATSVEYACSALINVDRLQNIFNTGIRIVLLATPSVPQSYLTLFRARNVTVHIQEAPPLADGAKKYYQDVLLKLVSFKLHRFDPSLKRILILDADQLIVRPLDYMFGLPDVDVAAPRAYWTSKSEPSSAFMLVTLSERLWRRIEIAMREIKSQIYDMQLIDDVLGWEIMLLPGHYVTLNSHWEVNDIPSWFRDDNDILITNAAVPNSTNATTFNQEKQKASRRAILYRVYEQASVLHFTALGKPWSYPIDQVHKMRPDAHPIFAQQFLTWRIAAKDLCPGPWNGSLINTI